MIPTIVQPVSGPGPGRPALPEDFVRSGSSTGGARADISGFAGLLEPSGDPFSAEIQDEALDLPAALGDEESVREPDPKDTRQGFHAVPIGRDLPLSGKGLPPLGDRLAVAKVVDPQIPTASPDIPARETGPETDQLTNAKAALLDDIGQLGVGPPVEKGGAEEQLPRRTDFVADDSSGLRDAMHPESAKVVDETLLVAPDKFNRESARYVAAPRATTETLEKAAQVRPDLALRSGEGPRPDKLDLGNAPHAAKGEPAIQVTKAARKQIQSEATLQTEAKLTKAVADTPQLEGQTKLAVPHRTVAPSSPNALTARIGEVAAERLPTPPRLGLADQRKADFHRSMAPLGKPSVPLEIDTLSSQKLHNGLATTQPNAAQSLSAASAAELSAQPAAINQTSTVSPPSEARAESRAIYNPISAIEQFGEAREMARASRPEVTVRHLEFGAVNVKVDIQGSDLRATLSARDPGFVPAIQAALADRAVAATNEMGNSSMQRQSDQGGSGGNSQTSSNASHGGGAGHQDQRYGSSTGAGQSMSQPYSEQTEANDESASTEPDLRKGANGPPKGDARGLFA